MRYPLLFLLAITILVAAVLTGYLRRRAVRRKLPIGWVANTGYVRELPAFRRRLSLVRLGFTTLVIAGLITGYALSALAAQPVKRLPEEQITASRDIVLCLDASGSMWEMNASVLDTFDSLVNAFNGERVALVIWNQTSRVVFPLTDDYSMVHRELQFARDVMSNGVVSFDSSTGSFTVTEDLYQFLAGTISLSEYEGSSLVGDGLANCALSFDQKGSQRSRSLILATDNQVEGEPIYTLDEAFNLLQQKEVTTYTLYASQYGAVTSPERLELERETEAHGGKFFDADNAEAASFIVGEIESEQKSELLDEAEYTEIDLTGDYIPYLALGTILLVGVAVGVRV